MTDTPTHFLNVDLELRGEDDLSDLVRAFEPDAYALHCTRDGQGYFANLELSSHPANAEVGIRSFVDLVHKLSPEARAAWNQVLTRDFSIGVAAGSDARSFEVGVTPAVLRIAADVGSGIVFVVYALAPPNSDGPPPRHCTQK